MFNTYFSARPILEKGALINIVLSDRSDGKTFDTKVRALEDYNENRSITIYLRRYKSEISELMYTTFFDEVLNLPKYKAHYGAWKFKGCKQGIKVQLPGRDDWDWIIYFIPLSMSGKLKSQLEVQRIHMINYDEFVPLDNRYIKDEITLLLEFYKSVDRERYTTRLIILGNKISQFNPLFDYFDIDLAINTNKTRLYRQGTLAVQIYGNQEHKQSDNKNKFNMLIQGTPYDNYNRGGILNQLDYKIMSHSGLEYFASFMTNKGEGSIWFDNTTLVISDSKRKDGYLITDKSYNVEREMYVVTMGKFKELFKTIYNSGKMYFENDNSFHLFEDILKKCNL